MIELPLIVHSQTIHCQNKISLYAPFHQLKFVKAENSTSERDQNVFSANRKLIKKAFQQIEGVSIEMSHRMKGSRSPI